MDPEGQDVPLLSSLPGCLDSIKVFPYIVHLKRDVIVSDTALSWDQLTASDVNFAVVRPLVFKYARLKNPAMVYTCLVVRSHFISVAEQDLAFSGVSFSRAILCEIMAMKLVHHFASNQIELVSVLTTSWSPLAGASDDVIEDVKNNLGGNQDDEVDDLQSALEMAISSSAKRFVASPIVQSVVNDIYSGHVVYSASANRSIVADNYKLRAIEIYDSRNAPWLNHYRLRVPRYGAILEFLNFACLLITFVLCLSRKHLAFLDPNKDLNAVHPFEVLFIVLAAAFALEEYTASIEHGWGSKTVQMWNVFDTAFIMITSLYLILRAKGLLSGDPSASDLGFDILACGACILFPRLAFFLVSNNVIILALRAMTAEFVFFMGIAAICFSGLLFTLWTLASETWTLKAIAWLMLQIWFGNTYLSFGQASSFHPCNHITVFGPILMVGFAALSNTLLLTILISILSNTFTRIDANANQEYLFQFTITTLEGMKSDALFSYQPPFNLLAFVILWPASWVLSPRSLHTANVFLIRLTSFLILLTISLYERYLLTHSSLRESAQVMAQSIYGTVPRPLRSLPFFKTLMGTDLHDIYEAIFDVEPDIAEEDEELFADREQDHVGLHSWSSHERGRNGTHTPPLIPPPPLEIHTPEGLARHGRRASSLPRSHPGRSSASPRKRKLSLRPSLAEPLRASATEAQGLGSLSPLARLFDTRLSDADAPGGGPSPVDARKLDKVEEGVRRVQELLEDVRELPVSKLKEEMHELQERQARIENLLLMLTRGMRNEAGSTAAPSRHDTL
ncbi:hypothetical protein B0F90DRAFT_1809383 [Multifurca ochricompacta]|uniref:Receptor-activated Ca2+-permeable cation channel n=1 Tax=Multifurca ochricompacta TaxID=376703 RepID=A0AAD4QNI7_9AGAM|nr:hypothetical protein B0F90DRAFT_1809383 [Multifurca ochricompacta]